MGYRFLDSEMEEVYDNDKHSWNGLEDKDCVYGGSLGYGYQSNSIAWRYKYTVMRVVACLNEK
jgi:hypothetical protein